MAPLADTIVVVHALIAAFIVSGFLLIPVGARLNWRWVRRRWLRLAHLVGILFVAAETVLGLACPLTIWEDWLRHGGAPDAGFIARWVRWVLYYDVPLWVFGSIYVVGAVIAVLLWRWVPPRRARNNP
ncbi:MAG TPA: DUF2784 domain-containing protein [Burkholderiales bacterium]|jgi:hypothetical protein